MSSAMVGLLVSLVVVGVIAFPLGHALRKHSWIFYVLAAAATALYCWTYAANVEMTSVRWFTVMFQKAYPASLFLALVMYTGALPDGNALKKRLLPIRGELSILSFILYLGHLFIYLTSYLPRLSTIVALNSNIAVSLVVAMVLTVIFAVLGVTSFKFVRTAMNAKAWKSLQRWAYPMVGLLLVHVVLVLGRSALRDPGSLAMFSICVYAVIIVVYAGLRIYKAAADKKAKDQA